MATLFCSSSRGPRSCLAVVWGWGDRLKNPAQTHTSRFQSFISKWNAPKPSQGPLTWSEGLPPPLESIKPANKAVVVVLYTPISTCNLWHVAECLFIGVVQFFLSFKSGSMASPFEDKLDIFYRLDLHLKYVQGFSSFFSLSVQGHTDIRAWLVQKMWLAMVQFPNRIIAA